MYDNITATICVHEMRTSHCIWTNIFRLLGYGNGLSKKHNYLTTTHILGKQKVIASKEFRSCNVETKGMTFPRYLYQSLELLSINPNIDLFA